MSEWIKYDGSDEQIAEIKRSRVLLRHKSGSERCRDEIFVEDLEWFLSKTTHYWLIPDDPLREMKVRQAMTGQPVWVKTICIGYKPCEFGGDEMYSKQHIYVTTIPNWNIPNAEYSFTEFKEEV